MADKNGKEQFIITRLYCICPESRDKKRNWVLQAEPIPKPSYKHKREYIDFEHHLPPYEKGWLNKQRESEIPDNPKNLKGK